MATKSRQYQAEKYKGNGKKRTSIGHSKLSRPKNKQKRRSFKKYRGQGK